MGNKVKLLVIAFKRSKMSEWIGLAYVRPEVQDCLSEEHYRYVIKKTIDEEFELGVREYPEEFEMAVEDIINLKQKEPENKIFVIYVYEDLFSLFKEFLNEHRINEEAEITIEDLDRIEQIKNPIEDENIYFILWKIPKKMFQVPNSVLPETWRGKDKIKRESRVIKGKDILLKKKIEDLFSSPSSS